MALSNVSEKSKMKSKPGKATMKPKKSLPLPKELLLRMHSLMVKSRVLEERLIKIYKAGEAFFEPPGSQHLVSENASKTEPARLLVFFVKNSGAAATRPAAADGKSP